MSRIRDESQQTNKWLRINSRARVERGGKSPRPEVNADMDLVGLVARNRSPRCELSNSLAAVQGRARRVEDHFVARLRPAEACPGAVVGLSETSFDGRFDMIQTDSIDPESLFGKRVRSGQIRVIDLGTVVEGDLVAVRVCEGEGSAERTVGRAGDDRLTIGRESVVDRLGIRRVQPDSCTNARLGHGIKVEARNYVSNGERDGLCVKDNGVWGTRWRTL
jgi:hypothetical protein